MSNSDVVAIGHVSSVLRTAHSPANSTGIFQYRVFAFNVERYLKSVPAETPDVIKVHQLGGDLPWTAPNGATGIGMDVDNDDTLQIGSRYLLFLSRLDKRNPIRKTPYAVSSLNGTVGYSADWDEHVFLDPAHSKVLLIGGNAVQLPHGQPFERGPQLTGVAEATAVAAALAAVDDASAAEHDPAGFYNSSAFLKYK